MLTTGVILDIYDDPKASVLLEKLAGRPLPQELADSEVLSAEKLASVPDRLFALVATNGGDTIRKFAMVDPAHTTTSVLYFLETAHLLPESVQKVAAANLVVGCEQYGLEAPELLLKMAGVGDVVGGALGALSLPGQVRDSRSRGAKTMDGFRAAQAGATSDMQKQADLTGTEMMPMVGQVSTFPHPKGTAHGASASSSSKKASWQHAGDLTGHHPQVKVAMEHTRYALPSSRRYPLDSYSDVKTAAAYFDEHCSHFSLEDRREYAVHLAARMEELSFPLTETVSKYAGHSYGPNIDIELLSRARNYLGTEHEGAYEVLAEKRASVEPYVMLEALDALDKLSGAATKYDAPLGFRDPYQAVYGKVAEEKKPWSWTQGNEYVTDDMLIGLARDRYRVLDQAFGLDVRKSFQKDPIGVFTSMPDPQKVVIARLAANDSNS